MLELTNLEKHFGHFPVINIQELRLAPGIHWLKGANGSGKSTLLRMMAGLLPFQGDIRLDEKFSVKAQPREYRLRVNHAEAEPAYPSFLTGEELTTFQQTCKGGGDEAIKEVRGILEIGEYLANPCGSYSSGMLKKLSLLLAFIGKPSWILLDEPLTTLDQSSQRSLCELIMSRRVNEGISFVITSHHDIDHDGIAFDQVHLLKDRQIQTHHHPA